MQWFPGIKRPRNEANQSSLSGAEVENKWSSTYTPTYHHSEHGTTLSLVLTLGRPRRRWVDNIRMDLQEVGCGYMDWIGLAQDRDRWGTLVSAVMNLRIP